MSTAHRFLRILFVGSLLLGAATQPTSKTITAPTQRPDNAVADLVFSGNRMSELEPCGCQSNMQGGIERESAYAEKLKGEGVPLLFLDSGGFISGTANPSNYLKTRYLLQAMSKIGYSVINVGFTDLTYGVDFLREQAERHGFELISASIVDPKMKEPLFEPFVIREFPDPKGTGTIRVAITGFTRPGAMTTPSTAPAATMESPKETPKPTPTPRVAPTPTERRKGVWVPAPGHAQMMARVTPTPQVNQAFFEALQKGMEEREQAEQEREGLSATERRMQELRALLSDTETVYSGSLNSAETVYVPADTQPAIPESKPAEMLTPPTPSPTPFHGIESSPEQTELSVLPRPEPNEFEALNPRPILEKLIPELRSKADFVIVLGHYPSRSAIELLQGIKGIDLLVSGYGSSEEPKMSTGEEYQMIIPGYTGRSIARTTLARNAATQTLETQGEIIAINAEMGADPEIESLLSEYREKTKSLPRPTVGNIKYTLAGAESCKTCHEAPYAHWTTMRHSHAMQTLIDKNQHYNPDCLPCHTTSYMKDNGFRDITSTPQFANVQCEVCHGPSLQHVNDSRAYQFGVDTSAQDKTQIIAKLKESMPQHTPPSELCQQCHTDKTDPEFDYQKKIQIVSHKDSALQRIVPSTRPIAETSPTGETP